MMICSIIFLGTELRLSCLQFAFFKSPGSLTSHQDPPKITEFSLTVTLASVPGSTGAVICSICTCMQMLYLHVFKLF